MNLNSVKFVPAGGKCTSGLVVVGEAPGEEEDKQGRPFVGRAGKLLDKMLEYIGLNRENVYVTNVCKVRPTKIQIPLSDKLFNRTPTDEELESWRLPLLREIYEINPTVILALGNCAAHTLLKTTEGITELRGKIRRLDLREIGKGEGTVVATYHPAYLLRKSGDKETNEQVKKDLKLVQKLLNL